MVYFARVEGRSTVADGKRVSPKDGGDRWGNKPKKKKVGACKA